MPFVPPSEESETPDPWPAGSVAPIAIVREIDLTESAGTISIKFSKGDRVSISDEAAFKALLKKVAAPNYPYPATSVDPVWPYGCPLSLNNSVKCYIIYALSDKTWQFRRRGVPITVSGDAKEKKAYFGSIKIDKNGDEQDPTATKDDCRVAYIVADADAAFAGLNEYVDRINLHVDLKFTGEGGRALYMPIVIDPDIRFPGGSGA